MKSISSVCNLEHLLGTVVTGNHLHRLFIDKKVGRHERDDASIGAIVFSRLFDGDMERISSFDEYGFTTRAGLYLHLYKAIHPVRSRSRPLCRFPTRYILIRSNF
jgi:hypothetical protein